MRTACIAHAIELASRDYGPITEIVSQCIEVGVIVPSILAIKLKEAGYKITYSNEPDTIGDGTGNWVKIWYRGEIVARAYSHDQADSLLQAVYGAMKEGR